MNRFITEIYILPYALPLVITAGISCFILYYAFQRRHIMGAGPLICMSFSVILWAICTAISMYQTDLETLIFISNLQSLASAVIAPSWMIFAMRYTQHDKWVTRTILGLLCIEPVPLMSLS
jgi:hypothetical protein